MSASELFSQPTVTASIVSAAVTLFIGMSALIVNALVNLALLRSRIRADLRLAEVRVSHEMRVAERKRELDEQAADWKRKADFAETVVADFCDAETRLRAIRNPGAFSFEAEERPGRAEEPDGVRRSRDTYWPVQRRLQAEAEFFNALHAKRFRARALFGAAAEEPFALIWELVTRVRGALDVLLRPERPMRPDVMLGLEDTIWNNSVEAEPDPIDAQSTLAVAKAEALFGAYLSAGLS